MTSRILALASLTIASFFFGAWVGQSPAPSGKYQPTKEQSLELRALRAEAQVAQLAAQQAQQQFSTKVQELTDAGKRIQSDNKWPKEVQFDPNTLAYSDPPERKPVESPEPKK